MNKVRLILVSLTILFAPCVFGQEELKQKVFQSLLGGTFPYSTKEARNYAAEYLTLFLDQLYNSVESPSDSVKTWAEGELGKIERLESTELILALDKLGKNPEFVQYRIDKIISNARLAISNIKSSTVVIDEAYWWVQLSMVLMSFEGADNYPEILISSKKSYTDKDKLETYIRLLKEGPSKINLVLLSILSNEGKGVN